MRFYVNFESWEGGRSTKVQNSAARLSLKAPRTDHITLDWLPTDARIKYKMYYLSKDHRMLTSRRGTLGSGHVDFRVDQKGRQGQQMLLPQFLI